MKEGLRTAFAYGLIAGSLLSCARSIVWPEAQRLIRAEFPDVEQISVEELSEWLASEDARPPLLLDVREEAEYRVSHLRGAVRVDPDDPEPELPAGVDRETPIVAYCSVGYRSSALVERLRSQGYTDVRNLEGSIFGWANRGLPVFREGVEVRQVHPYDRRWGRLLDEELRAYSVR